MKQWSQPHPATRGTSLQRQPYHKPHTALGATGHWVKTAGILAPLIIGEFIKDPEQKWRYIRMAAVATALLSEGMWAHKISNERKAAREHEEQCHLQGYEPAMLP